MDYVLLEKVGFFVKLFTSGGYFIAGSYLFKTGVQYVKDYRTSVANESGVE